MSHCPSQDWDRHVKAEDDAVEAEIAWWGINKDRVIRVACAILSNPNVDPFKQGESDVIEQAAKIVMRIMERAEPM